MSNFKERLLTGTLFVIVLLWSVFQSEVSASILFLIIILLCQREFYGFFKETSVHPQKLVGILGGLVFFAISVATYQFNFPNTLFLIIPIIFSIFVIELFRNKPNPITNIAYTVMGIIYIAVPFALLHELAYFKHYHFSDTYNYEIIMGYFFILWANDTGAYLVGKNFGRTKLFERISPKKTWEGSIGGILLGLGVGFLNSIWFKNLDGLTWLSVAFITVLFGSLGDLVESLFKRSLKIKDSGTLLPGHGGVLDRFDGIFVSAPMVYAFLRIISLFN